MNSKSSIKSRMIFVEWLILMVLFLFTVPLLGCEKVTHMEASNKDIGTSPATALLAHNPHGEHTLWPDNAVPYQFDVEYTEDMRQEVYASMEDIRRQTCVRWVPRASDDHTYVQFMIGDGCYSVIGRSPWPGPQDLSLNPQQGCLQRSVVVHEMMHAIGFGHEQNRWDRDDYVVVHEDRIDPNMINNFKKSLRPSTPGWESFSYEIGSVMHYAGNFFGTGRGDTMEPRVPGTKMGNSVGMTEMDVKQINFLYKCGGETMGPDRETRVGEKRGDVMPPADDVLRNITLHVSVLGRAIDRAAASADAPALHPSPPALSCYILLAAVVGMLLPSSPAPSSCIQLAAVVGMLLPSPPAPSSCILLAAVVGMLLLSPPATSSCILLRAVVGMLLPSPPAPSSRILLAAVVVMGCHQKLTC